MWISGMDDLLLPPLARICERARCAMADHRISHIELDDATIIWRSADIEQERRIAIFDLIEENLFKPVRAAERGLTLSGEQRPAFEHVTDRQGLSVVVGYAGTGKSAVALTWSRRLPSHAPAAQGCKAASLPYRRRHSPRV